MCYRVTMKRISVFCAVLVAGGALSVGAYAAVGALDPTFPDPSTWATATTWHIAPAPGADYIIKRQLGTSYDNTVDDTSPVTLTTTAGDKITTHSSPWEPIDVTQFGVPSDATVVRLQFKAVITAVPNTEGTVYAFAKDDGSSICPGPTGFENYPVDYTWDGEAGSGGEKCWAVHASIDAGTGNGVREFNTVDIPVTNGKFDFAWGYRRKAGTYPSGDAIAVGVWIDGWAN